MAMRIDAHQHLWKFVPSEYDWIDFSMTALQRDFLPADLLAELKTSGYQGSIAVQARQSLEETRWLLELAKHSPFILGVVGWVDLRSPGVATQLAEFAGNRKFVGVRHIVQSEPDDRFLLQPDFLRGISLLGDFDLSYDILIYPKHLDVASEFVSRFPKQRFVLDHLAKPQIKTGEIERWAKGVRALAGAPNVFCKLSGMVTEADWQNWTPQHMKPYLDVAFDAFGGERLMIGSDWPVCLLASSYSSVMKIVEDYTAANAPQSLDAVLGGTAERFWRI